jgi:hypothetical protein
MTSGVALGEDFPQYAVLKAQSLSRGMPVTSGALLTRQLGDATAARSALLASLCTGACAPTTSTLADGVRVTSGKWKLEVYGDGTSGLYQASDVIANAHAQQVPIAGRMTQASLENAGRAFVASTLSKVISLDANEQLIPIATAYRREGGQDAKGVMAAESVVANRVVFGRTIGGVPVVGGGSRVVITFANDGSLESFHYDWPRYVSTNQSRTALAPGDIVSRVQQAIGLKTAAGGSASQAASLTAASLSSYPVDLSSTTQLQALECGYFDPGLSQRDANAPVQMGCAYHVLESGSGGLAGFAGAVPAAQQVEADSQWAEASMANGTTVSGPSGPPAAGH